MADQHKMHTEPEYKQQLIAEFAGLFDEADTNKDGLLDSNEWPVFVNLQYENEKQKFGDAV